MMLHTQLITCALFLYSTLVCAISNEKLAKESNKNGGIIQLTGANYKRILGSTRSSYIAVLLTATNPQIGCTLCVEFNPEFETMASSWFKDHPNGLSTNDDSTGLFFAKADFIDSKSHEVFQHYNINNVPRLFLFSPNGDLDTYDVINFPSEAGITRVANLINYLREFTGFSDYQVYQAINWGSVFITAFFTAVTTIVIKKYKSLVARVLTSRSVWGFGSVFFIILLVAGYMFNQIRGSQFAGVSQDGSAVVYFLERQQQNQYGIETQIMSFVYAIPAASVVALIEVVPAITKFFSKDKNNNPTSTKALVIQLCLALFFSTVIYIFCSGLVAVFKLKSPDYPFKLLKLSFS